MIDPKELGFYIQTISYYILDNIVSPICGIGGIMADLYQADIDCYTLGDEQESEIIIQTICKKFNLPCSEYPPIDETMPMALIALYIIENGEYSDVL